MRIGRLAGIFPIPRGVLAAAHPPRISPGLKANLVENFANFQPYGLAFREINTLFHLLLAARPGMGAEQFDKVKVKLL